MFQTKVLEKIKRHVLCSVTFFFGFENRVVYEEMWISMVEPGRPQTTIRRVRFACWTTKATHTHSEYVTLTAVHYHNGCPNVPKYYVTRTLPVCFSTPPVLKSLPPDILTQPASSSTASIPTATLTV